MDYSDVLPLLQGLPTGLKGPAIVGKALFGFLQYYIVCPNFLKGVIADSQQTLWKQISKNIFSFEQSNLPNEYSLEPIVLKHKVVRSFILYC